MAAPWTFVSLGSVVQTSLSGSVSGLAFGQPPTAGNLLVCWWCGDGVTSFPTQPSGWSVIQSQAGTSCACVMYSKIAVGNDSVPGFNSKGSDVQSVQLGEFFGTQNPVVRGHEPVATGTTSPLTAAAGPVDSSPNCLYVACGTVFYSTTTSTNTLSMSFNTNNAVATTTLLGGTTANQYAFAYGFASSNASAISATMTFTTTNTVTGADVIAASILPGTFSSTGPPNVVGIRMGRPGL